jgi:CxxC-x17-CxxC domain-containing protein
MIVFEDRQLRCRDCGVDFIWSAGEQEFFHDKGLVNEPLRCPGCRISRRESRHAPRAQHEVTCARCGRVAAVPFVPRQDRPVYCSSCFESLRS